MKIHLYGNNANMAFNFCKFLRRKNVEAVVFVDRFPLVESDLPEWESADVSGNDWVKYVDVSIKGLLKLGKNERQFLCELKKCDLIHSFGEASMLTRFASRPYVHWTYGYDLDNMPFKSGSLKHFVLSRLQRGALKKADLIIYSMPHQKESIDKLGLSNARYFPPIPIDTDRYTRISENNIVDIRSKYNCDLLFAHLSRQEWVRNEPGQQNKGNDRLFRAFARFIKQSNKKVIMLVAEKGRDINESKKLITELGIDKNIIWTAPWKKEELIKNLSAVDMVFDQFNAGSAGLLVLECMSIGIPTFIHFGREYESFFAEPPPVVNVSSEDDICNKMLELSQDPDKRRHIGTEAHDWIMKYYHWEKIIDKFIEFYKGVLNTNVCKENI